MLVVKPHLARANTYEIDQDSNQKIEVRNKKRPTKRGGWKGIAFSWMMNVVTPQAEPPLCFTTRVRQTTSHAVTRLGTWRRSLVLPMAVTIPLPVSDSFDNFSSEFGEVDSALEGTAVEELAELSRPISLTNDVPQKDDEYFVTYCQSKIP